LFLYFFVLNTRTLVPSVHGQLKATAHLYELFAPVHLYVSHVI